MVDLGMAFVDNWVVGKEKSCYWLSNDIVGWVYLSLYGVDLR